MFQRWWFVFLFALICYVCYEVGCHKQRKDEAELKADLYTKKKELVASLAKQQQLKDRLVHQEDYKAIEFTLMKELGVVKEGQIKVIFDANS